MICFSSFSQINISGDGYSTLRVTGKVGNSGGVCPNNKITGGLQWIATKDRNGKYETIVQGNASYPDNGKALANESFDSNTIIFRDDKQITELVIGTSYKPKGNRCFGNDFTDQKISITGNYDKYFDFSNLKLNQPGEVQINVDPVINLTNQDTNNTFIGAESSIVVQAIAGVEPQYFEWMYHIEGDRVYRQISPVRGFWQDVWNDLPSGYQGKNSLNIKAKDFLPKEAIGKKIFLRASKKSDNAPIELFYAMSAPHIVSIEEIETSCFDTTDGKIKINFSRPLEDGETLTLDFSGTYQGDIYNISKDGNLGGGKLAPDNSYTIEYLAKGKSHLNLLGFCKKNGYNASTYVNDPEHQKDFEVTSPPRVDFSLVKKNDVLCSGGSQDGAIIITATGGSAKRGIYQYSLNNTVTWQNFSNGAQHTIKGLSVGTYFVHVRKVKDINDKGGGCFAQNAQGSNKYLSMQIDEPAAVVSLYKTSTQEPPFHGGTNGNITVSVTGGTPINGNSYMYEWRNSKNAVISNTKTTTQFGGGLYAIILKDVPADIYTFTVWDANYATAADKTGCTIIPVNIVLKQPDPLEVTLNVKKTISCNVTNQFGNEADINPADGQRDESQDGILEVNVKGGVPFTGFNNGGLPYKYFWKKQQKNGSWITINHHEATIENLSHGNYSVNVEDKNGIRLGDYVNNVLVAERDSIQFMKQPDKLELTFTKEDIFCSQGDNGWIKTNVKGGTPPYKYQWSNGEKTDNITGLNTGNYFVQITDAKGCVVQGSILIKQPNSMLINETVINPTCFQGNDGTINLAPTGGVQPYQYIWNTGQTTQSISNLTAGKYSVTLTDAQGCILIQKFELKDPAPVPIDLGADRTICQDQIVDLDVSFPSATKYEWTSTNGFTSDKAKVSLTEAGIYKVKVTTDLGCIGEDEIEISINNAKISSEFLLSTQAYMDEEVILINTSNPLGETTKWNIPNDVTIVDENEQYITLKFKDLGTYDISLEQTQGECYAIYTKSIMVEKRSILTNKNATGIAFINDFIVSPNPSNGNFKVLVNLENESPVNLRLFASNGQSSLLQKKEAGEKKYLFDFDVTLSSGIYILVLETEQQTLVKKIIIY